ncbi:MAG: hypothetical protein QNJ38_01780 [Prochloraceae cyanobacterium]|nr:hypothetical protein [Prochloraceae cyanobacterium]
MIQSYLCLEGARAKSTGNDLVKLAADSERRGHGKHGKQGYKKLTIAKKNSLFVGLSFRNGAITAILISLVFANKLLKIARIRDNNEPIEEIIK